MEYWCPDCFKTIAKESFGYPVCCGATMRQGKGPRNDKQLPVNERLWQMSRELDAYCQNHSVTDWELNFIADMFNKQLLKESLVGMQSHHIVRLHEKYC